MRVCVCAVVINIYLLCDKNLPVEWPEPSQPGIGHLKRDESLRLGQYFRYFNELICALNYNRGVLLTYLLEN